MRAAFCPAPGRIELREVARARSPGRRGGRPRARLRHLRQRSALVSRRFSRPGGLPGTRDLRRGGLARRRASTGLREGDRVGGRAPGRLPRVHLLPQRRLQLCARCAVLGLQRGGRPRRCVAVPAYALFRLPAGLDFAIGALAEPTAVCVHAVRLAGIGLGERVLVLGAGTIGLLSRARGACGRARRTWRSPPAIRSRRRMARRFGATHVFSGAARGKRGAWRHVPRHPVDAVIETVGGAADTIDEASGRCDRAARWRCSACSPRRRLWPALALVAKEVRLVGSMMYGRAGPRPDFEIALELLERRRDERASWSPTARARRDPARFRDGGGQGRRGDQGQRRSVKAPRAVRPR